MLAIILFGMFELKDYRQESFEVKWIYFQYLFCERNF